MAEPISTDKIVRQLCLRCGICCNGVLFRDVELQAGDDPARLRGLGLDLQARRPGGRAGVDGTFSSDGAPGSAKAAFSNASEKSGARVTRPSEVRGSEAGSLENGSEASAASPADRAWKLRQPCAALGSDGCCEVYADRPSRCRTFECDLFQRVAAGHRTIPEALRVIRAALARAERVKGLLRQLGDTEEALALSLRFQRLQKTACSGRLTEDSAALYAELTLAVHDLNLILGEEFHP
jgi:hypothetical protein